MLWNKYIIRLSYLKKIRKNKLQERVNHASESKDSRYDVTLCRNFPLSIDSWRADMTSYYAEIFRTSYSAEIFLFR
jgi:hypothetical protein